MTPLISRLALASTALSATLAASPALAGPTPGTPTVAAGSNINFSTDTGVNTMASAGTTVSTIDGTASQLNVHLGSNQNSIINWNSFDVASGASVNFSGNSNHAVLNRVTGGNFSFIDGAINAEGVSVFLLNPNGILFGEGSFITAGGFLGSTMDLTDADFLDGYPYSFFGASTAAISGQPAILTPSAGTFNGVRLGDVVMAGRAIGLDAEIVAAGDVVLFAHGAFTLAASPGSPLSFGWVPGTETNVANAFSLDGTITAASVKMYMDSSVANTMNLHEATIATSGPDGIVLSSQSFSDTIPASIFGDAVLTAGGAGQVVVAATNDLEIASATTTGAGQVVLTAALGDATAGAIASGAGVRLDAAGTLSVGDVTAATNVVIGSLLNAETVNLTGNVTAGGNYTVRAESVTLGGTGAVTQKAKGLVDIAATDGAITGTSGLTLMSNSDGMGPGDLVLRGSNAGIAMEGTVLKAGPAKQSILRLIMPLGINAIEFGSISAAGWDSQLTGGASCANCLYLPQSQLSFGDIDLTGAMFIYDAKSIATGALTTARDVYFVTSGGIAIDGSVTAPDGVWLYGNGGAVDIQGIVDTAFLTGSSSGTFTAEAENLIDSLRAITAGTLLSINNAGNLRLDSAISAAEGSVFITTGGDLNLQGNQVGAGGGGSIQLSAAGLMAADTGAALIGQDIALTAGDWTGGILSNTVLQETRDLTINDRLGGFFLGFDLAAQRNLTFNTLNGGGLTVNGVLSSVGNAGTVTATGAEVTVGSAGKLAGKNAVVSSAGAFTNQSGSDALVATGGHWVVYAANPATSTFDNLNSGQTAIWNASLSTLAPGSVSGNRYVFAYQPTLTVTTTGADKTYGDDLTGSLSGMYSLSGLQTGVAGAFLSDSASSVYSGAPTIVSEGAAADAGVAGSPYAVTATQGSLTLLNGYQLAIVNSGEITVDPKALTATVTANDKTYDGTTAATGSVSLDGVIGGDQVSVTGASFAFADANAGSDKAVTISGAALGGADAGNYTVSLPASVLADILAKQLTATVTANDKTYDGTTDATGSLTLDGVIAGDEVLAGATFTFADKNAGTDKAVTVSGAALTGADAGNYTLVVPASTLADILAKQLTVTVSADDKTYDGTTAATGSVSLGGVVGSDEVSTSGTVFAFADRSAGTDKTVTVSGTTLTGDDAGNYTLTVPASTLADILAKQLTVTVTADDKTYDGTTAATGSLALDGVIGGDEVSAGASFAFADKNAGSDKTVNLTGATLSGADAANYSISVPASVLADILAKELTAAIAADDKTYDGTTAATGSAALTGAIEGDEVALEGFALAFADKNVGSDKGVNITGGMLTGADAGNYTVTIPASALADILAKELTVVATANDKTYDGTTTATGTLSIGGAIEGDDVGVSGGAFAFADENAGNGKVVTVSGATLTGADAGNYTFTVPAQTVADVFRKELIATVTADDKTYDGTTAATGTVNLSGVIAGDQVSSDGATFAFADKNAGAGKAVTVSDVELTGADAANYSVIVPGAVLADILARSIVIAAQDAAKVEGEADPALAYDIGGLGLVAGDTLSGALVRESGEAPGQYVIAQGSLDAGSNYAVTFEPGTFTIAVAPVDPPPVDPELPALEATRSVHRSLILPSQVDAPSETADRTTEASALCAADDRDCVVAD